MYSVCMCVCVCVCMCVCVSVHAWMCVCVFVYTCVCMSARTLAICHASHYITATRTRVCHLFMCDLNKLAIATTICMEDIFTALHAPIVLAHALLLYMYWVKSPGGVLMVAWIRSLLPFKTIISSGDTCKD